jgi:hypothetical protein
MAEGERLERSDRPLPGPAKQYADRPGDSRMAQGNP